MITKINTIQGIGRYRKNKPMLELQKNHVIFGFNGTGKSTLSDIFYSLSDKEHIPALIERKTLTTEDGIESEPMQIEFETDSDSLIFENSKWNQTYPVYVFNDHYIDDYIFIESNHTTNEQSAVFGKEEPKLAKEIEELKAELTIHTKGINDFISIKKDLFGNLGLGKLKIKEIGVESRVQKIAELKLYTLGLV